MATTMTETVTETVTDQQAYEWLQSEWPLLARHMDGITDKCQGAVVLADRITPYFFLDNARLLVQAAARYAISLEVEKRL